MARAGLNRKSTLATATLVLAAEAPDLDVLANFGGRISGFEHHRGITHTFVGIPLVAAFVVLVLYLGYHCFGHRRGASGKPAPRWGTLFWLAGLACVSHILLDFTNNYGVRPWEPFSYRWYSWDIVYIVEPVLWMILAGALLLPSLFRLIASEMHSGSRAPVPHGRAMAVSALLLVGVFWGLRDYQHRRAIAALQALTYQGEIPVRVSAYPYYVNPFRWYGVAETNHFYSTMEVNSFTPEVDPQSRATVRFKPEQTPVVLAAEQSRLGRVFLDWGKYPLTETERLGPDEGFVVRFYDLRFMYLRSSRRPPLGGWVKLSPNLRVTDENFGWRKAPH